MSNDELTVLSDDLDHHILSKFSRNRIYAEFEQFSQSLLKDISQVPHEELSELKTKLRNTCDKYSQSHASYKYEKIFEQLSNNRHVCIIKKDKGWGVIEIQSKCLELLKITKQFEERNSTVHSLGKVYGTSELHKLPINGVVHDFLIRPRV